MSKKRIVFKWIVFGLAIAINIFIIVNGFLNGDVSSKESDGFSKAAADVINSVNEDTITKENFPAFASFNRKLFGHFLLFVASGLTSTFAIHDFVTCPKISKSYFILAISFGFGVVIAVISELAQLTTSGRAFSFMDILIDSGGYLLGSAVIFVIYFAKEIKNKNIQVLQ